MRSAFRMLAVATLLLGIAHAQADVKMPAIFGSGMVIQQGMEAPLWGTADPGEEVTVTFAGQERKAVADDKGKWMVRLPVLQATANQTGQVMTVQGKNKLTFTDVLIGEVWLCSGQSNMQWILRQTGDGAKAAANANHPNIRLFSVRARTTGETPTAEMGGTWEACTPATAITFSAVAYHFGRELHEQLNVPIGLINSSVGGTKAEAWTSREALHKHLPEFDKAYESHVNPGHQLARLDAERQQSLQARQESFEALHRIEADEEAAGVIAGETFDDTTWKAVKLPGTYSSNRMPAADGSIWLRRTITLPADWQGRDIVLQLGPMQEVDVTWFNGAIVGRTGSLGGKELSKAGTHRTYQVPGRLVKAGTNTIAIRVMTRVGRSAVWGSPRAAFNLTLADGSDAPAIPLSGQWRFHQEHVVPPSQPDPRSNRNRPTVLFNSRIYPLIPYGIRGVTWYQGESNAAKAKQYRTLLPTLINDWRSRWGQDDMPFLVVQLAGYGNNAQNVHDTPWANLREAQAYTARSLPNVGLAVAIDIGDARNIHPANKLDVGKRLALIALAKTYGRDVVYAGPTFKALAIQGDKARISFDHVAGGLKVKGDKLGQFIIAGKDGVFHHATATIEGDEVIVHSPQVAEPAAVRYAWGNTPQATLYNDHGLPAVPFATDKWSNEP